MPRLITTIFDHNYVNKTKRERVRLMTTDDLYLVQIICTDLFTNKFIQVDEEAFDSQYEATEYLIDEWSIPEKDIKEHIYQQEKDYD